MKENTWVVIPACNEEKHIKKVVGGARRYLNNVAVVDDGSRDKTAELAKGVWVLRHFVNLGKGAALKTGCDFVLRKGAKFIVIMDSDGQHKPDDIPKFLSALNRVDVVFSYRSGFTKMPFILKFGNHFINAATRLLYGIRLKDTQCGFRAFNANAYRKIRWAASDYGVESEIIANAAKNKLKYKEIGIETIYSDRYKGTTVMDGMKIVLNMIMWKFRR